METYRTCSFAGSLTAVSWRLAASGGVDVAGTVTVVADPWDHRGRVVASIMLRLTVPWAHMEVSVDGRRVATLDLAQPEPEPAAAHGYLFREKLVLPAESLDGRTHRLDVVLDALECPTMPGRRGHRLVVGRGFLASYETAFYARRVATRDSIGGWTAAP
jgi:hypothetical protein